MSIYHMLRKASEAGIEITPNIEGIELKAGDQYTFNTFVEEVILIYDGEEWRILVARPTRSRPDRDPEEVKLL